MPIVIQSSGITIVPTGMLTLPSAPTNVGQIADSVNLSTYIVSNFIDWTAPTAGPYPLSYYKVYVNGTYTQSSSGTTTNVTHTYLYSNVPNRYQVSAVDTHGNEGPMSTVDIFYVYHNGHGQLGTAAAGTPWDGNCQGNYCNAILGRDLGGNGAEPAFNGQDTTFPLPGQTYDCLFHQNSYGLWQEAATWYYGFGWSGNSTVGTTGNGPFGLDMSRFTKKIWKYHTSNTTPSLLVACGQNGQWNGASPDCSACTVVNDLSTIPAASTNGVQNTYSANTWVTMQMPLTCTGQLLQHSFYKDSIKDNNENTLDCYFADVGYVSGAAEWIFSGGACNGTWGATAYVGGGGNLDPAGYCWYNDSAGLLNGWTNNSSAVGGTINYSFVTQPTLSQLIPYQNANGASGLSGLCQPGLSSAVAQYPYVIQVTPAAANDGWQILNSSGRNVSGYNYLTFGHLPTNASFGLTVQLTNASGTPIGNSISANSYTHDAWGPGSGAGTTNWTVYNIPLSAFGSVGSTVHGIQVTDSGGHIFYITAPAFFQLN